MKSREHEPTAYTEDKLVAFQLASIEDDIRVGDAESEIRAMRASEAGFIQIMAHRSSEARLVLDEFFDPSSRVEFDEGRHGYKSAALLEADVISAVRSGQTSVILFDTLDPAPQPESFAVALVLKHIGFSSGSVNPYRICSHASDKAVPLMLGLLDDDRSNFQHFQERAGLYIPGAVACYVMYNEERDRSLTIQFETPTRERDPIEQVF